MFNFDPEIDTKTWTDIKQMFQEEIKEREAVYAKVFEAEAKGTRVVVIYGNTHEISKNYENRHRWKIYVRLADKEIDPNQLIDKVDFTLHRTFSNPYISKKSAPFEYQCVGSKTFEIPIKITWKKWIKMPPTEMSHTLNFELNGSHKTFIIYADRKILKNECKTTAKLTGIQRLIRKKQLNR